MKIAIVNQPMDGIIPPHQNSIGIWTYQVARRLAPSCDVAVYARWRRLQPKVEHDENVNYRFVLAAPNRVSSKFSKLFSRFYQVKRPLIASSLYHLEYILQVAYDLRKHPSDIIHIHNFSQFVPIIRAFNPKAKIVLQMHCEWLTQFDPTLVRQRLNKTDLILSSSQYIIEKIRRHFPDFADRCHPVISGIDVDHFVSTGNHNVAQSNKTKQVLFVGRVSPEKGVHILLDAFREVIKHFPDTHLNIVGPVGLVPFEFIIALSDEDKVRDLASFYQGNDYLSHLKTRLSSDVVARVFFRGFIPYSNLINYYRNADVFVFPSVWNEPLGVPPIEAMASEVPVVATRGGGLKEIVEEGKTGLLVERGDASALANAILYLLQNEDLRRKMGKAARQRAVEHFSWKRTTERLLYQYRSIYESNEKKELDDV